MTLFAIALFVVCGWLAPSLAHATAPVTATVPAAVTSDLEAPTATAEVWVDVESDAARSGIGAISWRQGTGPWNQLQVSRTVFGATGIAAAVPGATEVRFLVSSRFSADVIVSFVASNGVVLAEHRIREAAFEPKQANGGWITWPDLAQGSPPNVEVVPGTGTPPGKDAAPAGRDDPAGAGSSSGVQALGQTGASPALLIGALAAAALAIGTGLFLLLRRSTAAPAVESDGGDTP